MGSVAHVSRRPDGRRIGLAAALVAAGLLLALLAMVAVGLLRLSPGELPSNQGPPAPRLGAAAAYDQARGQLVVFSGSDGKTAGYLDDTWTWDGSFWSRMHPPKSPAGRQQAASAYDPVHRVVLLFGGAGATPSPKSVPVDLSDTWTWDGRTWTQHQTQHVPALASSWPSALAFDPISHTVVLYGHTAIDYAMQTWAWNGSDWTQLRPLTDPGIDMPEMVSTPNQVLLLGVGQRLGGRYFDQTWTWTGSDWKRLEPKVNLSGGAAVYDTQRGEVVAFDGDTWTWDGATWTRRHPSASPAGQGYMVYAAALHEIVVWGDVDGNDNSDLWAWDGSTWKLLAAGPTRPIDTRGSDYLGTMTPAAAEAAIRATVTATSPVLMPSWLPVGVEADARATADGFSVDYRSDQRDKIVTLGVIVANPAPGDTRSQEVSVRFRGGRADYFVYDPTAPVSQRWLMWNEPGTMANPETKGPGVPYFLSSDGLTDQEFWQVANSLR